MPYLTRVHQLQDPAMMREQTNKRMWNQFYCEYLESRFLRAEEVDDADIFLVHNEFVQAAHRLTGMQ